MRTTEPGQCVDGAGNLITGSGFMVIEAARLRALAMMAYRREGRSFAWIARRYGVTTPRVRAILAREQQWQHREGADLGRALAMLWRGFGGGTRAGENPGGGPEKINGLAEYLPPKCPSR